MEEHPLHRQLKPAGLTNLQEEKETVVDLKLTDSTQLAG